MAELTTKINNKYHLNIIQAYLPTSSHTNEEVDTVYEEIYNLVNNNKAYCNIVMGDFNAKIGQDNAPELGTGPYGLGIRNARGDSLINFAVRHQLKSMHEHSVQEESQQALDMDLTQWSHKERD